VTSAPYAIGIDAGGTNLKGVAIERTGRVLARKITRAADEPVTALVRGFVDDLARQAGGSPTAYGIAGPGIANPNGRSIWWMQGRRDEIEGLDWASHLETARDVRVLNDAQAALLGEVWQGAARGCRNVLLLTLGTGVGGAAIVDGRLLRGHLGRAGHFGHVSLDPVGSGDIVGTPGSLEDAIGDCTIARRTGGRFRTTAALLADDSAVAHETWRASVRALAAAIASFVNVLDPERVILGGGIAAAGEKLFEPLAAELDHMEWRPHGRRVEIVRATAGEYAGAVGAAYHALRMDDDGEAG
jgi:glucokinase